MAKITETLFNRGLLPAISMSNQATGISIKANYKIEKSMMQNAKKVQKKVQIKNSFLKYFILQFMSVISPTLVDSILFHVNGLSLNAVSQKLADLLGYTYKKENQLSITNIGMLDIPQRYGEFECGDIKFVPPVVTYGKRVIGIVSDKDGMSIIYHFMNDLDIKAESAFFSSANANLREILE